MIDTVDSQTAFAIHFAVAFAVAFVVGVAIAVCVITAYIDEDEDIVVTLARAGLIGSLAGLVWPFLAVAGVLSGVAFCVLRLWQFLTWLSHRNGNIPPKSKSETTT